MIVPDIFNQLKKKTVLVAGDLMLDTYTIGKARRISPEAPVPVVCVQAEDHRPGGAGNVVLNLLSLGMHVSILGRVGSNKESEILCGVLEQEGAEISSIVVQPNYHTPVKNRVIADGQQLVRVDFEEITPISELLEQQIVESLPKILEDIDIVAISDYGKGFLTKTLLNSLIEAARERGISVIVDPKGTDFTRYRGVDLIKPNLSEAYAAANMTCDFPLEKAVDKIIEQVGGCCVMVTRSSEGISLFHPGAPKEDFPAHIREVKDVTGAGDTVLAMVVCAAANKLSYAEAARLSNIAAGLAVEKLGCARVTLSELAERLLESHCSETKILTKTHLMTLQHALNQKKCYLLQLYSEEGFTKEIIRSIKLLGKKMEGTLFVHVIDANETTPFVELLTSLQEVDYVLLNGMFETFAKAIRLEETHLCAN